jgi:hypothetical protein
MYIAVKEGEEKGITIRKTKDRRGIEQGKQRGPDRMNRQAVTRNSSEDVPATASILCGLRTIRFPVHAATV